jgi:ribulose-phosphate 3-epimerase
MDNHYVPNLTIGPVVCEAIRPFAVKNGQPVCIDVHLMVEPVDRIIPDFAKAGATLISFHPEATSHIDRTLGLIKEVGCQSGLVLNPATPLQYLDFVLDKIDLVLLMSVNPGFGGQQFIPSTIDKIRQTRQLLNIYAQKSGRQIRLEVDGGVNVQNIAQISAAGADTFVAGSAIFGKPDYAHVISEMRRELATAQ